MGLLACALAAATVVARTEPGERPVATGTMATVAVADVPLVAAARRASSTLRRHVLTAGPERIAIQLRAPGRARFVGRAPAGGTTTDWNRREIYTNSRARRTTDQKACATWQSQTADQVQQGLAVRVRDAGGRLRAVTLTKNTIIGFYWQFNLLTWDTAREGDPWRAVGQFDMGDVVVRDGALAPFPWRACLRVRGRTVAFKVWLPNREPEPSYGDDVHARSATLPRGFGAGGLPGWYVGHVPPGESTSYRDMTPWPR